MGSARYLTVDRAMTLEASEDGTRLACASVSGSEPSVEPEMLNQEMEVEECMNEIGFGPAQVRVIAVAGLLLSADAMEMMLLSFLGPSVVCEWGISHEEEALLTTVVFLGMLLGAYLCGVVADQFGRRLALKWLATCSAVLGIASAAVRSYGQLLLVRGLMGVMLGGSSIGFAYVMEFLPTSHRGRWGILIELFWSFGTMLEVSLAWMIFGLSESKGAWRTLLLASSVPVFLGAFLFVFNFVPISPRYLTASGRHAEAYEVLRKLAKTNGKSLPQNGSLRQHGMDPNRGSGNPLDCLHAVRGVFSPAFRRLTLFLWFLWFTNAFSYYGIVLLTTSLAVVGGDGGDAASRSDSNSTRVLRGLGSPDDVAYCDPDTLSPFRDSSAFVAVFIATISELPGTLFAAYLVDTLGRKYSQALCFGGAFAALVFMFFLPEGPSPAVTACLFFARALITAAFVLTYVYTPEVYPTSMRTTAFGLANSFSRVGGMLAPFVGADLVERGETDLAVFVFCAFTGTATMASLLLPVETKGVALKDSPQECATGGDDLSPIALPTRRAASSSVDMHEAPPSGAAVSTVELH